MIWMILLITAALTALYLITPLLPAKTREMKLRVSVFAALFIGASLGTYTLIGSPNLTNAKQAETPPQPTGQPPIGQAQVTPEQITAMVDGLAARLAEDPEDPAGWTRLIRSRIVLGDIAALIQDHKTMSNVYQARPEMIAQISQDSGFNDYAARIIAQE